MPARVAVTAGDHPARVTTDRRGFTGGTVVRCAGPWRSSGNWWASVSHRPDPPSHLTHSTHLTFWDHDEWDVALSDGATYRLFRDRARDAWFIEGIVD